MQLLGEPALDVAEDDKELTVRAEMPGIDPKDLDVTVSGNQLFAGTNGGGKLAGTSNRAFVFSMTTTRGSRAARAVRTSRALSGLLSLTKMIS